MLTDLRIQNYALIRRLEISFREGFSIVTGETGAGKSIILGALGLILGNRAESGVMQDAEKKCVIEGRFRIVNYGLEDWFAGNDLDWENDTLLRREIAPGGKSRAFINDTPVNLNILKELGEKLIDIHSQHQTIKLTGPSFQIALLDSFALHKQELAAYREQFQQYKKLLRKLAELQDLEHKSQKDFDYYNFQLGELTAASLQSGEEKTLEEEQNLLSNAELIEQRLQQANYMLYGNEQSIHSQLSELRRQLSSIAEFNPALSQIYERLNSLLIEVKDLADEASSFSESVSVDNKRLEEVNARLQLINQLLHKHRFSSTDELLSLAEELQQKVSSVENLSDEIISTEKEVEKQRTTLTKLAEKISKNRHAQKEALEKNLQGLLQELGMPQAHIDIKLSRLENLSENGLDAIDILFSANKGSNPERVSQVASGGELSRLMLCFKYILADTIFLPTIIFDEIDTGVSGEVANKVGRMLKRMSQSHQVLSITHQPQVAAMGDHHYVVYKTFGDDFTETGIRELKPAERVGEIATMIAGQNPSAVAIENARELLAFQ
jgi:DNA repair protein RecN (Recombination protein N)